MNQTISCIGTGAMGSSLVRAFCKRFDPALITVTDKETQKARALADETGCVFTETNEEAAKAKYVFIAVKPQFLSELMNEISGCVPHSSVIISMAAGVKIERLKSLASADSRFIRIMPNVCAQAEQAMTAICAENSVSEEELAEVKEILSAAGKVDQISEDLMDCVTAIGGSAPAFVFMFIEALADAAVRCGLPRAKACEYAAQITKGSAELLLKTKSHPAALKDSVCSPAGTTMEGVAALEKCGFRSAVIEAVSAAYRKAAGV